MCKRFFPNLTLVDLNDVVELFNYHEIKHSYYCLDNQVMEIREDRYNTAILKLLSELPTTYQLHNNNQITSKFRSLIFKLKKLLYGVNCIGIKHYFGNLKKDPIKIDKSFEGYK